MRNTEDTKARIYDAAVAMFYEHGYAAASMRSIVQAAGVQMSSVYYHYKNKHDLLYEVMRRSIEESTSFVLRSLHGMNGAEEKLRAALGAEVDWHTSRQREAFIADAELRRLEGVYRRDVIALRDREEAIFRDIIDEGIRDGVFVVEDSRVVVRMLMTAATGVARWYRADGPERPAAIARAFADALLDGLRARPALDVVQGTNRRRANRPAPIARQA
ncbi:TetR family transcriptional regulator [Dactylosporangium sp. CA-233914]|uniref:TetR family transcriptional regulator n=1 Tax=Dactylosporangium sp. CA-233914 TaxID=3239934 RepID=UPI003D928D6C